MKHESPALRRAFFACRPRPLRQHRRDQAHDRRGARYFLRTGAGAEPKSRRPAARRAAIRLGDPDRGEQDLRRRRDRTGDRGRPERVRRKPRAGDQGQMAGDPRAPSRARAASDRAAAIQQGEGGAGVVRRHPFGRSAEHVRGAGEGDPESRQARRCCSSRSIPAPSRKRPACCRRTPTRFSRTAATVTV